MSKEFRYQLLQIAIVTFTYLLISKLFLAPKIMEVIV